MHLSYVALSFRRVGDLRLAVFPGKTNPTLTPTNTIGIPGHTHAVARTTTSDGKTTTLAYDPAGNTTNRTTTATTGTTTQTLAWNTQGRVDALTTTGLGATRYVYDADGQILARTDPQGVTVHTPAGELRNTNGQLSGVRHYTHDGVQVAQRDHTGAIKGLHQDPVGSGLLAIDWTDLSKTTWRMSDPYGNQLGLLNGPWPSQRGYLGLPTDPTTGLIETGARLYDPAAGRFLSVDPILDTTNPQTLNGYTYTAQDPINASDPSGLRLCDGPCPSGEKTGSSWIWNPWSASQQKLYRPTPAQATTRPKAAPKSSGAVAVGPHQYPLSGQVATPRPYTREALGGLAEVAIGLAGGVVCVFTALIGCLIAGGVGGAAGRAANRAINGEEFDPAETAGAGAVGTGVNLLGLGIGKGVSAAKGAAAERAAAKGAAQLRPPVPRYVRTSNGTVVDRQSISKVLSRQRQERHIRTHDLYGGGGYFETPEDAEAVLRAFHDGSAEVLGMKGPDIVVRVSSVRGYNVNTAHGIASQETHVFFIRGTRSPSVVPMNPRWTP